jgi:hypothetical protein
MNLNSKPSKPFQSKTIIFVLNHFGGQLVFVLCYIDVPINMNSTLIVHAMEKAVDYPLIKLHFCCFTVAPATEL